jgi:hypothetical protein
MSVFLPSLVVVKERIKCDCDKTYSNRSNLQNHLESVQKQLVHRCLECDATFLFEATFDNTFGRFTSGSKSGLALHLRRLCARKPFQCDRCRRLVAEHKVCISRSIWLFKWFGIRDSIAATTLRRRPMFALTSHRSHQQSVIQNHNK